MKRFRSLASRAPALADRQRVLTLEYPSTSDPRPRYGYGRPPHRAVEQLFARSVCGVKATLDILAAYDRDLGRIPSATTPDSRAPCWRNEWLPGLDTIALYAFMRERAPDRYVEVGSGQSTKVVKRAIEDAGLRTTIRSIDPEPRAEVDALCDETMREPLELVDLDRAFGDLTEGDIVFFDGSHRVLPNSDCVAFYLDVLPHLPSGVLVAMHDIWLPDDYPEGFFDLWWSEQYMLAATLVADAGRRYDVVLPAYWASGVPELASSLEPVWAQPETQDVNRRGSALWLTIR